MIPAHLPYSQKNFRCFHSSMQDDGLRAQQLKWDFPKKFNLTIFGKLMGPDGKPIDEEEWSGIKIPYIGADDPYEKNIDFPDENTLKDGDIIQGNPNVRVDVAIRSLMLLTYDSIARNLPRAIDDYNLYARIMNTKWAHKSSACVFVPTNGGKGSLVSKNTPGINPYGE